MVMVALSKCLPVVTDLKRGVVAVVVSGLVASSFLARPRGFLDFLDLLALRAGMGAS